VLKLIFWLLVAVNGALYAYGQGYLGQFRGNEHEPARLAKQLNADKLRLVSAEQANAAVAAAQAATAAAEASVTAAIAAAQAGAPAAEPPKPEGPRPVACVEIGNFQLADARTFENRIAPLALGDRQARRNVPGQEVSAYIVHIPPQGGKEGAERKVAELKRLGVTNYFVMSDNPTMRWAVSLGVFKSETAAHNLQAALTKQGVHGIRITPRMSGSQQLVFQFRDIDSDIRDRLDRIRAGFPNTERKTCK
jgi:hypothetical protein